MHKYGPYHEEVRRDVLAMDEILSRLQDELEHTLMMITADHGQVEIKREVFLEDYPDLMDCLLMPPSIEVRAASLFVKPAQSERFEALFQDLLGDCFLLMPREEVFASGLLGPGVAHRKIDDFIGDYLACATGQTILRYRSLFNRPRTPFKGHHAGLCVEEMMVPLIIAHK
jgi:predicted AlkP superfamily pyrophosphatase or phosphodiesterase